MKKVRWNLEIRQGWFVLIRKGIELWCKRIKTSKNAIFLENEGMSYTDMGKWKHSIYYNGIQII